MPGLNGVDPVNHIPEDLLGAWWRRQGSRVDKALLGLGDLHELAIIDVVEIDFEDRVAGCGFVDAELVPSQAVEEIINDIDLVLRDARIVPLRVENEAHDRAEVAVLFHTVLRQVNRVHFEVKALSVDGVLGFGVEVELSHLKDLFLVKLLRVEVVWFPGSHVLGDWGLKFKQRGIGVGHPFILVLPL